MIFSVSLSSPKEGEWGVRLVGNDGLLSMFVPCNSDLAAVALANALVVNSPMFKYAMEATP